METGRRRCQVYAELGQFGAASVNPQLGGAQIPGESKGRGWVSQTQFLQAALLPLRGMGEPTEGGSLQVAGDIAHHQPLRAVATMALAGLRVAWPLS